MKVNYSPTVDGLKLISAFEEDGDDMIIIPEGVCAIGPKAFADCKKITQVSIPSSVKKICKSAFENCTSLEFVHLSEGLETIEDWAFCNCTSLKKIVLPSSCTYLGDMVFLLCTKLQEILMGDNVTHIGEDAFKNCRKLKYINLPVYSDKCKYGAPLFYNCKSLLDENGLIVINDVIYGVDNHLLTIKIPDNTHIYDLGIFKSSDMNELILPYDIATYETSDFIYLAKNTHLESICANDGIVIFPGQVFVEDKDKYIVLPKGDKHIWDSIEDTNIRFIERNLLNKPQLLSQAIKFGLLDNYEVQNDLLKLIDDYKDVEQYYEGKSIFLNYMASPEVAARRQDKEAQHRDLMFRCMDQFVLLKDPNAIKSIAISVECELTTFDSMDEFWELVSLCGSEKYDRYSLAQVRVFVIRDINNYDQYSANKKYGNRIIRYLTEDEFNELIGRKI